MPLPLLSKRTTPSPETYPLVDPLIVAAAAFAWCWAKAAAAALASIPDPRAAIAHAASSDVDFHASAAIPGADSIRSLLPSSCGRRRLAFDD